MTIFLPLQLTGLAADWWTDTIADGPHMNWQELRAAFEEYFLTPVTRNARAAEFEKLVQTPDMSVQQYHHLFTRLSRYAPHLVPTETIKLERFIDTLIPPLSTQLITHHFDTYSQAVEKARKLEKKMFDIDQASQHSKKQHGNPPSASASHGQFMSSDFVGTQGYSGTTGNQVRGRTAKVNQSQNSQSQSNLQGDQIQTRPTQGEYCRRCGVAHQGPCTRGVFACYYCKELGHRKDSCPKLQGGSTFSYSVERPSPPVVSQPSYVQYSGSQSYAPAGRGSGSTPRGNKDGGTVRQNKKQMFAVGVQAPQAPRTETGGKAVEGAPDWEEVENF